MSFFKNNNVKNKHFIRIPFTSGIIAIWRSFCVWLIPFHNFWFFVCLLKISLIKDSISPPLSNGSTKQGLPSSLIFRYHFHFSFFFQRVTSALQAETPKMPSLVRTSWRLAPKSRQRKRRPSTSLSRAKGSRPREPREPVRKRARTRRNSWSSKWEPKLSSHSWKRRYKLTSVINRFVLLTKTIRLTLIFIFTDWGMFGCWW